MYLPMTKVEQEIEQEICCCPGIKGLNYKGMEEIYITPKYIRIEKSCSSQVIILNSQLIIKDGETDHFQNAVLQRH